MLQKNIMEITIMLITSTYDSNEVNFRGLEKENTVAWQEMRLSIYLGQDQLGCILRQSVVPTRACLLFSDKPLKRKSSPQIGIIFLSLALLFGYYTPLSSVQFISVAQSCSTICDPMNHSTPGLPVRHQLPESTQTHVQ